MNAETINKIDWGKVSMAFAVSIVFIMQQYHAMRLDEVKTVVTKHTQINDEIAFNQENRKKVFKDIDLRLKALESK